MEFLYSIKFHLFILLLFILPLSILSAKQNILILTDSNQKYPLYPHLELMFDSTNILSIDDIQSLIDKYNFKKLKKGTNNLGYLNETVWLKFTIKNLSSKSDWLVNFNYGTIDEVYFYFSDGSSRFSEYRAGLKYPLKIRPIQHRLIVFPIKLELGDQQSFFIKIRSGKSIPIDLELESEKEFFRSDSIKVLLYGIFYGGIILMALFNLFLFLSIKDLSYLYYFLYAISIAFYQSAVDGFGYTIFVPNGLLSFNLNLGVIGVWILYIFGTLFAREFLQIKNVSKYLSRILLGFAGVNIFLIILTLTGRTQKSDVTVFLGIIYITLMIISGVFSLYKSNNNAKYYLIATSFLLIGMFSRAIKNLGLIDTTIISDYGLPNGMLIEMAIFSFALGNRINEIKRSEEKEKALIRSRIASDLHDEIGSNLSSISVASQMLVKSRNLQENEKQQLEDITLTAKESAESMKDIIWFINPSNDNPVDIIQKMKETATKMLPDTVYNFICNDCKILDGRDLGFRRNLFLIYKEILNNIVKHSQAKNVSINIFEKSDKIILEIEDDGIGFESERISGNGLGLKNIIRRAESLGGTATVTSLNSHGTKWQVIV